MKAREEEGEAYLTVNSCASGNTIVSVLRGEEDALLILMLVSVCRKKSSS